MIPPYAARMQVLCRAGAACIPGVGDGSAQQRLARRRHRVCAASSAHDTVLACGTRAPSITDGRIARRPTCADADRPSTAAAVAAVPLAVACDKRADPVYLQSRPAIAR